MRDAETPQSTSTQTWSAIASESKQQLTSVPEVIPESTGNLDLRMLRHDLLATLRHIDTVTSFLAEDIETGSIDKVNGHIGTIRDRTDVARGIIDGLVAFQTAPDRKPIESANVVQVIDEVVARHAGEADITFVIDTPNADQWAACYLERTALASCLQALVNNAVVHRAGRSGSVFIEAAQTETDVEFIIRDDGYGIAPDLWEVVFDPLRKVHRTGGVNGVGFGLSIARRLAESRGGHVQISASSASGTSVSMHWPIPTPVRNTKFA